MWKGTAVNLNSNPHNNNIIPNVKVYGVFSTVSILKMYFVITLKFVDPVNPYIIDIPNSKRLEESAPSIKYFKPASVDNRDVRLKAANTYKQRLCISMLK